MPADQWKDMEIRDREDPFSSQRGKPLHMQKMIAALKFLEKLFLNKL